MMEQNPPSRKTLELPENSAMDGDPTFGLGQGAGEGGADNLVMGGNNADPTSVGESREGREVCARTKCW